MMTQSDRRISLETILEDEGKIIRGMVEDYFHGDVGSGDREARMKYVMTSGGKMLRPILSVRVFRSVGGRGDSIYPFALLWEILHNFSLVHDDLPIMDNDDFRRGKPTLHKVYGMKEAVLTGVDLLNYCFELVSELVGRFRLSDTLAMNVTVLITEAAGFGGMVGGQMMDLYWEGRQFGPETVESIHRLKTARMMEGSVRMGGILGGAGEEELEALGAYGLHLGLAYQIADDLLDSRSDFHRMGKVTGRDSELGKATYVSMYGRAEAERRLVKEIDTARNALNRSNVDDILLRELLDFTIERGTDIGTGPATSSADKKNRDGKYN